MVNGSEPDGWPPSPNLAGLMLVSIPLITIVGNLLVILSVLRYRALQSAINYLILGLAVADLCVALFVMPYAVYVHVYRGMWRLGNLMCDIYSATDVACSTASILLLAVISFDRYRAVSRPIQYSRQSQNVRRVFGVIAGIWLISLALASPMVLGANVRPIDANPHECRFYNAEFSIGSSIISFVIPCVLVLFVYMRIIVALKKREKAARLRRLNKAAFPHGISGTARSSENDDEAGRIVAGPVVNVMMMALPSMSRHMRRFERHREAIEAAGDDVDVDVAEPPAAALLRRVLRPGLLPASRSLSFAKEHEMAGSNSPRSSIDESLSEQIHVITNDFISEGYASQSRRSSTGDGSEPSQASVQERRHRKTKPSSSNNVRAAGKYNKGLGEEMRSVSFTERERGPIPALLRTISRRSPRLFRSFSPKHDTPLVLSNPGARQMSQTETETITASHAEAGTSVVSRSTTANSELLGSIESPGTVVQDDITETTSPKDESQPTVTFALTVRNMAGSPEQQLKGSLEAPPDDNLAVQIMTRGSVSHNIMSPIARMDSRETMRSNESRNQSLRKNRNGFAGKLAKKALRHEQSLKRKVSKAQRKEKRATKTLGVVVGVFLVCWVPFFAINIVNAVCILTKKEFCQVGFDLFFYCTWIGYMNSFMNPIIYTIFNTEFRRAFKALICGRDAARNHLLNKQVHL